MKVYRYKRRYRIQITGDGGYRAMRGGEEIGYFYARRFSDRKPGDDPEPNPLMLAVQAIDADRERRKTA